MEISIYGESTKYINKSNIRLKRGDLNECYDRHRVYDYSHTRIVADNGNAFITTEEGSEFVVDVEYGYDILFPKELLSKKDDN